MPGSYSTTLSGTNKTWITNQTPTTNGPSNGGYKAGNETDPPYAGQSIDLRGHQKANPTWQDKATLGEKKAIR